MGFTCKVNGVTVAQDCPGATITQALNARDTFRCKVTSATGSVRPQQDDDFTVIEDGEIVNIFDGIIDRPTLGGFLDDGLAAVTTDIQASDYKALPARRAVTTFITTRSLHDMLAFLVDPAQKILSPYGVTLDAAQVNPGPTIPDMDLTAYPYIDAVLDQIIQYCGPDYAWKIGSGKKLLGYQLGSSAAPFNIADGDGNVWGDLKIEPNRQNFNNHIIVRFNNAARAAYGFINTTANATNTESIVVGSTTYVFDSVLSGTANHVKIGATKEDTLANLVAAIDGAAGAGTLYATGTTANTQVSAFVRSDHVSATVTANTPGASGNSIGVSSACAGMHWFGEGGGSISNLQLGNDVSLTNVVDYPTTLPATPSDYVVQSDTTDLTVATALAQAIYAVRSVIPRIAKYSTFRTGIRVGMTQVINSAIRFCNATFTFQEIQAVEQIDGRVLRTVALQEGTVAKGTNWRDTFKQWTGKVGGSANTVGGVTVISSGSTSGRTAYFLGGDGVQWVRSATPTWVPVMGAADNGAIRRGGLEVIIDTTVLGRTTGTAYIRLRARSGSVQARLRNLDDATNAGVSSAITVTELTTVAFAVTLATGSKAYRLELLPGSANVDVQGIGYVEF